MAHNGNAKLKTLYVRQILEEETDEEHGLTMRQLIERLGEYGIGAERKSVYRDLQLLREFGVDIQTYPRKPIEYAIGRRDFSLSELMLLVDAVESCKALTQRQSNALITNLKLLASDPQRAALDRRIHVSGRVTAKNDGIFKSIDAIHEALRKRRMVEFMYYRYGADGARHATHGGRPHRVTPVAVSFEDGFYYLTAWNDEHASMIEFRIDRMGKLTVSEAKAAANDEVTHHAFDDDPHENFGRLGGDPLTATLLVDADKVEIIMDRFGERAQLRARDEGIAEAVVPIRRSEQFFGWVAGLGGTVRIAAPASLKRAYKEYLQGLIENI